MRSFGKWLGRLLLALLVLIGGLWVFGPRETVDLSPRFDAATLGDDLDAYLAAAEAEVPDIREGLQKQIVWAGAPGEVTPLSIIYLHGFSASLGEIRPVPDDLATALGANLYYARLTGHGRDGAAMAEASVADWMIDTTEALAIGRRLGERVIVVSTSTGSTLAALALTDPALREGVAGAVFVSPNFRLANPVAPALTWPAARHYLPLLAGAERSFEPQNEDHGRFWTTRYPSVAVFPMAALVKAAREADYADVPTPALWIAAEADQVVSYAAAAEIIARWGGPSEVTLLTMGPGDDPFSHVILGDTLAPGQTAAGTERIRTWIKSLP